MNDFDKKKKAAWEEAQKEGIIDVVVASDVSIETVEAATALMKKHGADVYDRLEQRRKALNG